MVLEEYLVLIKGPLGNNQGQFTYWVDPHKKPNIKSVLKDFKSRSHIQNVHEWRVCTLGGGEIRFLADYADRILVLKPLASITNDILRLPSLGQQSSRRDVSPDVRHLSQSYTTLPSLMSSSATSQSSDAATIAATTATNGRRQLRRSQSTDVNAATIIYDNNDKNIGGVVGRNGRRRRRRKKVFTANNVDMQDGVVDKIDNGVPMDSRDVNGNNNSNNGPSIKTSKRKTKF